MIIGSFAFGLVIGYLFGVQRGKKVHSIVQIGKDSTTMVSCMNNYVTTRKEIE